MPFYIILLLISNSLCAINSIKYEKEVTNLGQIIHTLEFNPQNIDIKLVQAANVGPALMRVGAVAKKFNALAAINGGFFHEKNKYVGSPAGACKIQDKWYGSAYQTRGAIGWQNNPHKVIIDRIKTIFNLQVNNKNILIHKLNLPPNNKQNSLYNLKHLMQNNTDDNLSVNISMNNKTNYDAQLLLGNVTLAKKIGAELLASSNILRLQPAIITEFNKKNQNDWHNLEYILGGGPLLVYNFKNVLDAKVEKLQHDFVTDKRARTAIGIKANGNWLVVVVEERFFLGDIGINLLELADYMLSKNCVMAVNLDGGRSSDLYLNPEIDLQQNIISSPLLLASDSVANVILFFNKQNT